MNLQVHLTARQLALGSGISESDIANVNSIEVKSITAPTLKENIIVGTVSKGNGDPINYGNRESLVVGNDLISGHFISTGSGTEINRKIPVRVESDTQRESINKQALSRAQHWREDALKYQTNEPTDHDVRLVTNGKESRVLVPKSPTADSSGMARFVNLNRNATEYFDGNYGDDSIKTVDVEGEEHIVIQGSHYKEMKEQFEENLRQKADVSTTDGFKVFLNTGNEADNGNAYMKLLLERTPSAHILSNMDEFAGIDLPENNIVTSNHVKLAAGEDVDEMPGLESSATAEEILQAQIFGEADEDEEAFIPSKPGALTITSFADADLNEM